MNTQPQPGQEPSNEMLVNISLLERSYFENKPDGSIPGQSVSFGTSGHRGTSLRSSFCEDHILAITQAVCDYRAKQGITGPLFLGKDTHHLSLLAEVTALEVLSANGVQTIMAENTGFTPTPVISHAILCYNRGRDSSLADGIIVTPSHNPPEDGGIKYNPPHGGPADTDATSVIENRANQLLLSGLREVKRIPLSQALSSGFILARDLISPYVNDLESVIDLPLIARSGLRIGVDPMGGASLSYWEPIAKRYGLNLSVVNPKIDPTFRFMTLDHDRRIRMDCSSPHAMARLLGLRNDYDLAFGNDPDADRHGIVVKSGLLNPNHYLAVAIDYLFRNRNNWAPNLVVGKTVVSSGIIDRVAADLPRKVAEVPVGFKWFVQGLYQGRYGFGGEESAGASFLRRDGSVWSTDKDGLIMDLLAAEMMAATEKDPGALFEELVAKFGRPFYERVDRPIAPEKKKLLKNLNTEKVKTNILAGDTILHKINRASGNDAEIGGLKVITSNGWFAARPSGTEDIYKVYAESFVSQLHLEQILKEASDLVLQALNDSDDAR